MASLIKRGNTWYVQYKEGNTWKRVSCKTSRKRLAEEVLNRYKVAEVEDDHELHHRRRNRVTLGYYMTRYLEQAKTNITPKWHRDMRYFLENRIKPYFGENTSLKDITKTKIEAYQKERLKTVKPRTVNLELVCLMTMLRKAVDQGELDVRYLPKFKKIKQTSKRLRFLSKEEIKQLLEAATVFSPDMEAYVRLMMYAGLRSGEALNLRWVDADLQREMLTIAPREDWNTKSGKGRFVPIPPALLTYLKQRKNDYPDKELIVDGRGDHTPYMLNRRFSRVVEEAGLPTSGDDKVTAHTLRHTYASHLVMNGTALYTVSQLLGHSDARVTQIYAHLAPDHLQEAVNAITY